ncbi:alpha/beta fold hydrolase [Clostridium sp. UBA6640]|uniref:alpha/beta fold hydrolase n=1 Tax=Clostridium sp. UBA6640 TaxID=1946370 RepID=UPI0025C07C2A|nr:alpha/beta hydrolase [Clostridium sp. UBA6640]
MNMIKNKRIIAIVGLAILVFLGFQIGNQFNSEAMAVSKQAPEAEVKRTSKAQEKLIFVIIHGSWADASQFDGVAAELRKLGHSVYVPELLGHGALTDKNVTHEQITNAVVEYIEEKDLKHIVLLGHSFGGTVVMKVAEQIPDRIDRVVFSNAFVPLDGQSVYDQLPPPAQETFKQLADASGNNTIMLPFPLFRDSFTNTASLEEAKEIYSKITPEPAGPLFQKLDLKKFYSLQIPKSYLNLTEDTALPPGPFAWHTNQSNHLGFYRYIQGDGDHFTTFQTEPKMIAQKFVEAGRP